MTTAAASHICVSLPISYSFLTILRIFIEVFRWKTLATKMNVGGWVVGQAAGRLVERTLTSRFRRITPQPIELHIKIIEQKCRVSHAGMTNLLGFSF